MDGKIWAQGLPQRQQRLFIIIESMNNDELSLDDPLPVKFKYYQAFNNLLKRLSLMIIVYCMLDQTTVMFYKHSITYNYGEFMKLLLAALLMLSALSAMAQESDLVLPGERWLAQHTHFVCEDGNTTAMQAPAELEQFNVLFGRLTTDYSLDNVLVKARFEQNGAECRYSALLFADNAAFTAALVDSKAYAVNGASDCSEGKAAIDSVLNFNSYKYLHGRAAIYFKASNAQAACGDHSDVIGIHFQAKGKIPQ